MRARIDISEVEAKTKIRAKYLRAIENEEWDLLPGPVYVKSFLKTYGEFLGLDSRLLIDEFKRRYERPSDGELRPISARTRERERQQRRRATLPPWIIIAAVIVAILVVLDLVGGGGSNPSKTTPVTGIHAKTKTPVKRKHHHRHRKKHEVVTQTVPTKVKLTLTPTADVYFCVTDQNGKQLIPGQDFQVGQTIPTVSAGKLLVDLGNNGVEMKVNGIPVGVTDTSPIDFELTTGASGPQGLPTGTTVNCS